MGDSTIAGSADAIGAAIAVVLTVGVVSELVTATAGTDAVATVAAVTSWTDADTGLSLIRTALFNSTAENKSNQIGISSQMSFEQSDA